MTTLNTINAVRCRLGRGHEKLLLHGLGEPIKVVVGIGDHVKTFHVHKDLFCSISPYFEAACSPEWMNSGDDFIPLPADDPELFELCVQWMYTGNFQYYEEDCVETLIRLFILADKLQINALQDRVISELVHSGLHRNINLSHIPLLYENLPDGSRLRDLAVDSYVVFERGRHDQKPDPELLKACAEFLYDVSVSYSTRAWNTWDADDDVDYSEFNIDEDLMFNRKPKDPMTKACWYHVHGTIGDCPTKDLIEGLRA
ncbi:hypothetical protein EV356DRAFT_564885 [Viridothelium virens]|uniref:BTB domain-containing protein n=1 Tax=Viridothelium virens TaxID=1048519 RepID=A0A6A6HG96_VIRVR|nr:hypothetical protein EV356DRAFT_564885 [Viridothelium virens]